jgi:hypothetical protein
MQRIDRDIVRLRGPNDQESSGQPESSTAPTAQEVCFEASLTICIALGIALIAQLLLGPFLP